MPDEPTAQFLALRKISQMPVTVQRLEDKMTVAQAMEGMSTAAAAKLAEGKIALTTAETKIAEAIGIQAAAG